MNPDQTALWEQSDLGTYCLQYGLADESSRRQNLLGVTRTMAVTISPRTVIITKRAIMIPRQFL